MIFEDRLKVTASNLSSQTLSVGATITMGAAVTGCRTLPQCISDGASNPLAIKANSTGVTFTIDEGSNWQDCLCDVTSTTTIVVRQILSGSNGTNAVTFSSATPTVYNCVPADWLRRVAVNSSAPFSQSVPLTQPGYAYMAPTTVSGALAFTPAANAVQGAFAYVRLTADGVNTPTFPGFTETIGSAGYMSTAGVVNLLEFSYDGYDYWFAASQAANAGAGGSATVTGVTVSPSTASVAGSGTQTFTAVVAGTNSPSQSVTWNASAGSITSGGVFTAPAATASTQSITITATSVADNSKSGTATVTVAASGSTVTGVTVSPSTATVAGFATQQFSASVAGTNSPSQSVTWSTSAGSINSSGLFTAPAGTASTQTVTVTATSAQDGTKSGTATVTISAATAPGAPTIGTAVAGDGYVDVAFTAPASNGGASITSYTATLSTGETNTGTTSPIRVAAANGTARTAHVTATNSVGTGAASAESNSVTPTVAVAIRFTQLTGINEGGTSPNFTYTGATTAAYSSQLGLSNQGLQSGVDGSMQLTLITSVTDGFILGLTTSSTPVAYGSLPYGIYCNGNSGAYKVITSGSPVAGNTINNLARANGDWVRLRRTGTTVYAEVCKDGINWQIFHSWTGVPTSAYKFDLLLNSTTSVGGLVGSGLA
jgi:hypothetical protein